MQLKYGSYDFPVNGVVVKEHVRVNQNAAGMPETWTNRLIVTGDLLAPVNSTNPQVDLSDLENALKAALRVPYQDLLFYADDTSVTATLLTNAGSLSGVRCVEGPSFEGDKATGEYAVRRAFSFVMESLTLCPNRFTKLTSFSESISYSGGLPIKTMCRSINKPPIDQITWPFTEYTAIQSGQAVGLLDWPFGGPNLGPALRFPAALLREAPKIEPSGPERVGPNGYQHYAVKWSASFASALPLLAAPTLWT